VDENLQYPEVRLRVEQSFAKIHVLRCFLDLSEIAEEVACKVLRIPWNSMQDFRAIVHVEPSSSVLMTSEISYAEHPGHPFSSAFSPRVSQSV